MLHNPLTVPLHHKTSGLDDLVFEWGSLPPGNRVIIALNWKARLSPGYLGLFMALNQHADKGAVVTYSDF